MSSASKSPSRIPEAGDVVAAKYRVVRRIAEGGMGVVVEAVHIQLEEKVAIKFLRPDALGNAAGVDVLARFLREARAALKIRSEHVVRVYDASVLEDEIPYIVMELLEGQDLEQVLQERGAFPIADVVDYILQAAEALAEAHSLGIIHRDLKPANLFLLESASGVPMIKVLDFGISKDNTVAGANMSLTSAQAVLGSPIYMSPEQMRSTKDVDARSDVWALGVILYELLTGRPPFGGETMPQVCSSILEDTPLPPSRLRNQIPMPVEKAVLRCLEKRPEERFPDVGALADALAPYGTEIGAESASRTARAMKRTTGGTSFFPGRPPPGTLTALATTNNKADTATQAETSAPSLRMPNSRRRAIVAAAWALGLTCVAIGIFAAARITAPAHTAGTPAQETATSAPPPPAPSPEQVTVPTTAPPVATSIELDPPQPTDLATATARQATPAPIARPRAAKPSPTPTASAAPPPAVASPPPSDPAKAVTWDERK